MIEMLPEWSYPQLFRELREWIGMDLMEFEKNKNLQKYGTEKRNNEQSEWATGRKT